MKVVRTIREIEKDRNTVVTVGTFDGVHLAHQEILREVVHRARNHNGRNVCFTFDPHPKEIVGKENRSVDLLTTLEERVEILGDLGIDILFVIEFTYEFSRQTPRQFYERYLINGVGIIEEVGGYDHMFGRDREGGINELKKLGEEYGFSVTILPPFRVDGEVVNSTKIRQFLLEGDVRRAAQFLGREYSLDGSVVKGDGRGASLGFPTANILPSSSKKLTPKDGVYLVRASIGTDKYYGMMNIGVRPTFETDHRRTVEVNLFDFNGSIYGSRIRVQFLERIRDEKRFASVRELVERMGRDKENCLKLKEQFIHNLV